MSDFNVGLVGYGNYSKWMALPCLHAIGARIAGIVEPDATKVDLFVKQYSHVIPYDSIEHLFSRQPRLDAVIACATPTVHEQVIEQSAIWKIPCLVEKPPATASLAVDRLLFKNPNLDSLVAVGLMKRFASGYRLVRGTVLPYLDEPACLYYRFNAGAIPGKEGKFFRDFGVHAFDLVSFLLGGESFCLGTVHRLTDESYAVCGRVGHHFVTILVDNRAGWANPNEYLEITFSGGRIAVDNVVAVTHYRTGIQRPVKNPEEWVANSDTLRWEPNWLLHASSTSSLSHQGYLGEYLQFKRLVLDKTRGDLATLKNAAEAMRCIEKIESASVTCLAGLPQLTKEIISGEHRPGTASSNTYTTAT